MVCIGDPWFIQAIHRLYKGIHGLSKSALCTQHILTYVSVTSHAQCTHQVEFIHLPPVPADMTAVQTTNRFPCSLI